MFLISPEACTSPYCQDELRQALDLKKGILPVIVRRLGVEYPGALPDDLANTLRPIEYIDFSLGITPSENEKFLESIYLLTPNLRTQRPSVRLSFFERWILSNQFIILEKVDPKNAESYIMMREAIEHGFELHYNWLSEYIYQGNDIMTEQECIEVIDILDMFRFLNYA